MNEYPEGKGLPKVSGLSDGGVDIAIHRGKEYMRREGERKRTI